jgi:phosphatidylglycerophosphatase A
MMLGAKLIATCLGMGYIQKGAGTIVSLAWCIAWYLMQLPGVLLESSLILLFLILGVWSANRVEQEWGHDSNKVVVDELMGMCMSLYLLPVHWFYTGAAFILFRFFDIAKPLYIRKAETLKGGWGVMADDLLAGIYTNLLLQAVLKTGLI